MEPYEEIANALQNSNRRNGTRTRAEDVRAAVVALRSSQFVFQSRSPGHFGVLRSMRDALEPHFELSGSRMVIDDTEGYAALVLVEDVSRLALSVEETIILLTLRWIFETKVELRDVETDGSVRADEAEIQQWYEGKSGRPWPKRPVVKAAIDLFERRGILISSLDDMDNRVVFIRGVVRLVTGSGWIGRMRAFLEAAESRGSPNLADIIGDGQVETDATDDAVVPENDESEHGDVN